MKKLLHFSSTKACTEKLLLALWGKLLQNYICFLFSKQWNVGQICNYISQSLEWYFSWNAQILIYWCRHPHNFSSEDCFQFWRVVDIGLNLKSTTIPPDLISNIFAQFKIFSRNFIRCHISDGLIKVLWFFNSCDQGFQNSLILPSFDSFD